ncbi:N-formylglutamate amidohydrolase [Aliifodinibius salipaludis]|uniref:N-formylglutamate amidohydrolase n=1 Tax=Fodinibius salipaludis TaxID=2032627 RepID=A0A2A2G9I6_9BACT|nr:N-formylglutamate amidohydrolase [Aliifodinibius salipaludis]PAU93507.1 N-formylglutamate amidohydrolase [Aliifodinibius salipaludis]
MGAQLIITCEHAGNEVPEEFRHLFDHGSEILKTHRGIDIGALELTNTISAMLEKEPYLNTVTRLLVDLNRSTQSPNLFSEFTREQPLHVREKIFKEYYQPHRKKIKEKIDQVIINGEQAIHVGIHTFTPVWENEEREVDVGFLFDPRNKAEQHFCYLWRTELSKRSAELRLKMNEPYRGTMDGFTTYLRRQYSDNNYLGLEIEVNQRFSKSSLEEEWQQLQEYIGESLQATVRIFNS